MAEKLAIAGGNRMVPEGFIKPWPYLTEDDREAVQAVLATERITEQQRIQAEGPVSYTHLTLPTICSV